MNNRRLISTKDKYASVMKNTPAIQDYIDAMKDDGIEHIMDNTDADMLSALITNVLHYMYLKDKQSILKMYSDVFAKYGMIYDLEAVSYSVWIPTSDPLYLIACSIMMTQCLHDSEALQEMLQYVKDGIIDAYSESFNELDPDQTGAVIKSFNKIMRISDASFSAVSEIRDFIGVLKKNVMVKTLFPDKGACFCQMAECYLNIIADKNRFYQLSWLYLNDFVTNGKFTGRVMFSLFDALIPMQMSFKCNQRKNCFYLLFHTYAEKFENKKRSEVVEIINRHLDHYQELMQKAFFERVKIASWGELRRLFENFNYSTLVMLPWVPKLSTLFWKVYSVSETELEETFLAIIFRVLNVSLLGKSEYSEVRRIMLEDLPDDIAYNVTDSLMYYLLAAKYADSEFTKIALDWFYSEMNKDNESISSLKSQNERLQSLVQEQQVQLANASKRLQEVNSVPSKIGFNDTEYEVHRLQSDNDNLQIEINKIREENSIQNEYISKLEELLANAKDITDEVNDDNNTVIEERVIVAGYISGVDQQKILKNLPNADFLTDRSRVIPGNTPIIVITSKMSHKLMFKILASTSKEFVYYYNGTNMQNLYKVLL